MARAWRLAVVTAALALFPILAKAALPRTAADMETAHGADAVKVRDDVLAPVPSLTVIARAQYADEVIKEFEKELSSDNADARLNTAILFENLKSVSCDRVFESMLTNKDPAVRFWGAKGLGTIADTLKKIGGTALTRATTFLKTAQSAEPSTVVKDQIDKTLALY